MNEPSEGKQPARLFGMQVIDTKGWILLGALVFFFVVLPIVAAVFR